MSPSARPAFVRRVRRMSAALDELEFAAPVTHVYNPLVYAWRAHRVYLERFGGGPKEVVLVGMNPGPFGMAQTGIPFGAVARVSDWMGIEAKIDRPAREHPKRPVLGFDTTREEVSGARLWGFAEERFGSAERFFERFFVANYCPLCFLEASGRNRTPDKLPAAERAALHERCDEILRVVVREMSPRFVVGIGAFAEARAREALAESALEEGFEFGRVLHPSPASPVANRGWAPRAAADLESIGIDVGDPPRARKAPPRAREKPPRAREKPPRAREKPKR